MRSLDLSEDLFGRAEFGGPSQRQHRGGFVFASEKKRQGMTRMKFYEDADVVEAPEVLRARERSSRAKMKVERSVEPVEKVRRRLRHKQPCEAYGAGVFKRRRFS
ncbi:unnamed protein product [Durusdinium trenchii]|uniref:Uncharacterized protein n=1 Tax=Durusdinium trenchii TaxID=1381693 RepID=A0ABP0QH20_9DINO